MSKDVPNIVELPDVAEFLKTSRKFIREVDLLEKSVLISSHKKLIKSTAAKVGTIALDYANRLGDEEETTNERYM